MARIIYSCFLKNDFIINISSLQLCIYELTKRGFLAPPPIEIDALYGTIKSRIPPQQNWSSIELNEKKEFSTSLRDSFGFDRLWNWESKQGRVLLLYATRYYLNKTFSDYSPYDGRWDEENRPWDYDHIFPRDWIKKTKNNPIVELFINSIGNIAPIPFSQNRGKSDSPPGNYLNDDNDLLLVTTSDPFISIDNFKSNQFYGFLHFTIMRFSFLLMKWYNALCIGDFFDLGTIYDTRKKLFIHIQEVIDNTNTAVFFTNTDNGLQYECSNGIDWAHPWLAIGIRVEDSNSVFPAVAWDGYSEKVEIGLRRHPTKSNIDQRKDVWYLGAHCKYLSISDKDNIEQKANALAAMLQELKEVLWSIQSDPSYLAYINWLASSI